ncbi:MAG: hypothetical protein LBK66_09220 [Spirochaetaceae bacterium]|jgi:hypothetical protein|nr:hypothetical protein [Spirochaetaceae bacterium]
MTLNIDYNEAVQIRNAGINALRQTLGEEMTAKFIALFNYYNINKDDSEDLYIKDYTEWRKTQSWYNNQTVEELFEQAAEYEKSYRELIPKGAKII